MTSRNERERVAETLPEVDGISPEAIARAKAMIGARLRTENFVRDASLGAMLNFVNGIGDTNPIFRDQEYAAYSKYGLHHRPPLRSLYAPLVGAHPLGLARHPRLFRGQRLGVFPQYAPRRRGELRPNGCWTCRSARAATRETLVIQFVETTYTNQRDELVARVVGWCTRHQRRASRERGKYASVPRRHEYAAEELEAIDQQVLGEKSRGGLTRYYEDTNIGDELEPVVRGPLSLQDVSAFLVGTGRSSAHGVLLREALRHPDHFFRNPEAGGGAGIHRHRPPARLGGRGGGRPRRLRLRPAAGVVDGHAGRQLDGRRRLSETPARRMPPLQRLRRHPVVQGPGHRQEHPRRRTVGGPGNLGRKPAGRSDRAGARPRSCSRPAIPACRGSPDGRALNLREVARSESMPPILPE